MWLLFDILFTVFALFCLPLLIFKQKYREGFWERLGKLPREELKKLEGFPVIWIHAVSVGEAMLALKLLESLKERLPHYRFAVSTITSAGQKTASLGLSPQDAVFYFPFDWRGVVRRFIREIKPALVVIMETELWPNFILECSHQSIPLVVINGRISNQAFGRYRWIRFLTKPVLQKITYFCMQSELAKDRILKMGAPWDRVVVTGNMKYDNSEVQGEGKFDLRPFEAWVGELKSSPLFIASSTHPGEEEIVLSVYRDLLVSLPSLKLLIAPRHVNRIAEIEAKVLANHFRPVRLSAGQNGFGKDAVYLLDSIGVLKELYRFGDVVFMGGSLVPRGGHNLAEPAVFAKAICYGPYTANFDEMARLFDEKEAGLRVRNSDELKAGVLNVLQNQGLKESLGKKARELVEAQSGAIIRNTDKVLQCLNLRS